MDAAATTKSKNNSISKTDILSELLSSCHLKPPIIFTNSTIKNLIAKKAMLADLIPPSLYIEFV